jgi:hypothetical protein
VKAGAKSCSECGSDDETGWSEDTVYDGVDLQDAYDDAAPAAAQPRRRVWDGRVVAALVLLLAGAAFLIRAC